MTNFNSTSGILLQNISFLRSQNNEFQTLQYQLTSQKKYRDLKEYDIDAYRIINFNQDVATRKNYISNIGRAQSVAKTYGTAFDGLVESADNLIKATNNSIGNNAGLPEGLNTELANNLLRDIEATLNTAYGGRYIFGGTTFDKAPVKDLTLLPTLDTSTLTPVNQSVLIYNGVTATLAQNGTSQLGPILPFFRNKIIPAGAQNVNNLGQAGVSSFEFTSNNFSYLNDFGADANSATNRLSTTNFTPLFNDDVFVARATTTELQKSAQLNEVTKLRVNDQRLVEYGFTATEPAFQKLIHAAMNLKAAAQKVNGADLPGEQARAFVDAARIEAQDALLGLRQLQVETAQIDDRLNNYNTLHSDFLNLTNDALGVLTGVDSSEVAVRLSNLQTLLQASYSAIGKQQSLSLVNYLK